MSLNPVTLTFEDGVAVISVDYPPVNTISPPVREGLFAAVGDIRARKGVAAVVLVCQGSTFFRERISVSSPVRRRRLSSVICFGSWNNCRCRSSRECTAWPWAGVLS